MKSLRNAPILEQMVSIKAALKGKTCDSVIRPAFWEIDEKEWEGASNELVRAWWIEGNQEATVKSGNCELFYKRKQPRKPVLNI